MVKVTFIDMQNERSFDLFERIWSNRCVFSIPKVMANHFIYSKGTQMYVNPGEKCVYCNNGCIINTDTPGEVKWSKEEVESLISIEKVDFNVPPEGSVEIVKDNFLKSYYRLMDNAYAVAVKDMSRFDFVKSAVDICSECTPRVRENKIYITCKAGLPVFDKSVAIYRPLNEQNK